ncbi:S-layer homology domain-containing protein [Nitriliruptoraceae bacterium ZYF776]|nr:S-layer homology domain-containing protein [Profundirhabdus halotolerans]
MASILDRASRTSLIGYPAVPGPRFRDAEGGPHQRAIDRLAAAGIVRGGTDGRFRPGDATRRDQAATLVIRWLGDQEARRRGR